MLTDVDDVGAAHILQSYSQPDYTLEHFVYEAPADIYNQEPIAYSTRAVEFSYPVDSIEYDKAIMDAIDAVNAT